MIRRIRVVSHSALKTRILRIAVQLINVGKRKKSIADKWKRKHRAELAILEMFLKQASKEKKK